MVEEGGTERHQDIGRGIDQALELGDLPPAHEVLVIFLNHLHFKRILGLRVLADLEIALLSQRCE